MQNIGGSVEGNKAATTKASDIEEIRVGWSPCCFCGENIQKSDIDPCSVQVSAVTGKWQYGSATHSALSQDLAHLRKHSHFLEPAHF